jgi:hypothetical protein
MGSRTVADKRADEFASMARTYAELMVGGQGDKVEAWAVVGFLEAVDERAARDHCSGKLPAQGLSGTTGTQGHRLGMGRCGGVKCHSR